MFGSFTNIKVFDIVREGVQVAGEQVGCGCDRAVRAEIVVYAAVGALAFVEVVEMVGGGEVSPFF